MCLTASAFTVGAKELGTAQYEEYEWTPMTIGAGGVISDYIFHPKEKGYAIVRGDVGGAWLRNPGDERWQSIANFTYDQYIWHGCDGIAMDPNDPDVLYWAAGYYTWANATGTVLKSTDRGKTWTNTGFNKKAFESNSKNKNGNTISVDPANSRIVYVGTYNYGLWYSEDGAGTWEQVKGLPTTNTVRNFVFDPTSVKDGRTQRIYAFVSTQGMYVTEDAGATWTKMEGYKGTSARHIRISNDGTVVTADGVGVFKYSDGEWSEISNMPGAQYTGVDIDPNNSNYIICVRRSDKDNVMCLPVLVSQDGGKTWFNATENPIKNIQAGYFEDDNFSSATLFVKMDPHDTKHVVIGDWYGIYETFDILARPQVTWKDDNLGIEELCVLNMQSHQENPYRLLITAMDQDGFPIVDLDVLQPRKFTDMFANKGGMRMMTVSGFDICYDNPNYVVRTGVGFTDWATSSYSEDGGDTWKNFTVNPVKDVGNRDGTRIKFSSNINEETGKPAHMVMYLSNKGLLLSDDMGESWEKSDALPKNLSFGFQNAFQFLDKDYVLDDTFYFYDFTKAQFYSSSDGGHTWEEKCNLPTVPSTQGACKMTAIPNSPGEVWIATGASAIHGITGELYRTTDGFKTITPVEGFKKVMGVTFGKAAPGRENVTMYVLGSRDDIIGMYRSIDSGKTWKLITDENVPGGFWNGQTVLCGDMHDFGVIYLAGGGSGVFYGKPAGTKIVPMTLNNSDVKKISELKLTINGNETTDKSVVYEEDVLYYPVGALFETLGATVKWNSKTCSVDIKRQIFDVTVYGSKSMGNPIWQTMSITQGSNMILLDGEEKKLSNKIINVDGKVYVPLNEILDLWELKLNIEESGKYQITDSTILID